MQAREPQDQPQPPLQPPPNFSPFFTLIHDPSTTSTIHPSRVHYLFSDDDASDLLTNACIRSLTPHHPPPANPPTESSQPPSLASSKHLVSSTASSSSSSRRTSRAHKSEKSKAKKNISGGTGEREERVLIIDMNETGDTVLSATSLSPEWQIINAEIRNAPTWDGGDERAGEEEDGEGRKLMLRVEGVGVGAEEDGGEASESAGGSAGLGEEEMLAIMDSFDRKMAVLRKIVGRDVGLVDGDDGAEQRELGVEEEGGEVKVDDKGEHIKEEKEGGGRAEN